MNSLDIGFLVGYLLVTVLRFIGVFGLLSAIASRTRLRLKLLDDCKDLQMIEVYEKETAIETEAWDKEVSALWKVPLWPVFGVMKIGNDLVNPVKNIVWFMKNRKK
jgi:hypothetical protein